MRDQRTHSADSVLNANLRRCVNAIMRAALPYTNRNFYFSDFILDAHQALSMVEGETAYVLIFDKETVFERNRDFLEAEYIGAGARGEALLRLYFENKTLCVTVEKEYN